MVIPGLTHAKKLVQKGKFYVFEKKFSRFEFDRWFHLTETVNERYKIILHTSSTNDGGIIFT